MCLLSLYAGRPAVHAGLVWGHQPAKHKKDSSIAGVLWRLFEIESTIWRRWGLDQKTCLSAVSGVSAVVVSCVPPPPPQQIHRRNDCRPMWNNRKSRQLPTHASPNTQQYITITISFMLHTALDETAVPFFFFVILFTVCAGLYQLRTH